MKPMLLEWGRRGGVAVMGGCMLLVALAPVTRAATYTYTPTNTATETWSSGANWSAVPVSAADTILTFMGANSTVFPNAVTNVNNNDVANPFTLNVLNLQGTGPATGAGTITIGGSALRLASNGSSNPVVALNALKGTAGLSYTNNSPITLAADTTFTGDGTAGFVLKGAISGAGSLTKCGTSTLELSGDSSGTFSGPIYIRGGGLRLNAGAGGRLPASQTFTFDGSGGAFNMDNNGSNQSITNGTVNFLSGHTTITSTRTTGNNAFLTLNSWNRSAGATVGFSVPNGSVGSNVKITLAGQSAGFVGGAFAYGGSSFALYDAATNTVRDLVYTATNTVPLSGNLTTLGATNSGKHVQYTAVAGATSTAVGTTSSNTLLTVASAASVSVGSVVTGNGIPADVYVTAISGNDLTLSAAASVTNGTIVTPYSAISAQTSDSVSSWQFKAAGGTLLLAPAQTLTVSSGGIWRGDNVNAAAAVIAGGNGITTASGQEMVFWSESINGWLSVQTPILNTSTGGIIKTGPGELRLAAANTFTGGVWLNGGIVKPQYAETPGVSGPFGASGPIYFYGGKLYPTAANGYDYSPRFSTAANQNFNVDTQGTNVTWAANLVSDGGTLTYNATGGGGSLTLTGTNTYSGGTTFTGGTLILGSDSALGTGPVTFNNSAASAVRNNSATATRTLRNALTFNTAQNIPFGVTDNSTIGSLVFTGPVTLGANVAVMAGSSGTTAGQTAVGFEGVIGDNGAGNTLTVPGLSSGTGAGYVFLLGTNTYSGQTTIGSGGGTVTVIANRLGNAGTAGSLGAPTGANATIRVTAGGGTTTQGTLRYTGGSTSTDRTIDMASTAGNVNATLDASGSGPITFTSIAASGASGAATSRKLSLTGVNTNANMISGAIPAGYNGNMKVEKNGNGTWVLSGNNAFTNGLTINSGRLVLDHANNAIVVNVTNAITLGDVLEIKGNASTATTLALGNLTLNNICLSKIILTRPGSAALGVTLGNTWAFGANGSTLFIDLSSGTTLACNPASQMNNGDIAYAVVKDGTGTGFAMTDGASIVRYTGGTAYASNSSSTTLNYTLSGNLTMATGSKNIYTLAVDTTGGGTLDLNGITLTANRSGTLAGGLLFTGTGNYAITNGIYAGASAYYSFIHQYSTGIVTLSAQAGINANSAQFLKDGPGTFVLGNRAFTGALRIFEGAVRADNVNVLTSGPIQVNSGGVLELGAAGSFAGALGTAAGNIQFSGDGGFSAYGGNRTVQLNGGTATIIWGSSNFVPDNNALVLSSPYSDSTIDFQNGLDLGYAQRVVDVRNGSGDVDARLSGVMTGRYGGGLIKRGAGALELTGANTYQGETWVEAGTLLVNNTSGSGTGSGLVSVRGGAALAGTGTIAGSLLVASNATLGVGSGVTGSLGTLTVNGNVTLAPNAIYKCEYQNGALDTLAVGGTLTLPAALTVNLSGLGGSMPNPVTLFTATTLAGATNLTGWTVTGLPSGYAPKIVGNSVTIRPVGLALIIR